MEIRQSIAVILVAIIFAAICDIATPQSTASAKLALADRQQFAEEDWGYYYYIDTEPWVGDERKDLEAAIKFQIAASSLKPIVEQCIPTPIAGSSLMRMDLRNLGWEYEDWKAVMDHNPYGGFTMLVRADWLLLELADMHESESGAYMRLLFGGGKDKPTTRDQVLLKLGVGSEQKHVFGMIEGESGVAVRKGGRIIESRPVQRGYCYITRDVLRLTSDRDPFANLLEVSQGASQHDGEEVIVMIPKFSETTGDRGALPIYFLADGKGNLVSRAPVDLVEDTKRFRGFAEIRFPAACFVSCHSAGYNMPTRHEFRELSKAGVLPFVNSQEKAADVRAFFLSQLTKELERANDDQQTITDLIAGMPHEELAAAYKRAVARYDAPLDMARVGEEFSDYGYQVEDVVAAIEVAANEGRVGAAVAGISRNRPIQRDAFEETFVGLLDEVKRWSANNQ